jgi:hypothetical protein
MFAPAQTYGTTTSSAGLAVFLIVYFVFIAAVAVLSIAGLWKAFTKAGKPGWAAIIPIYNLYVMTEVAGKPAWWLIFGFIPLVNIVLYIEFAKAYGLGGGFGVGLGLLFPIFAAILGFGSARYVGPAGGGYPPAGGYGPPAGGYGPPPPGYGAPPPPPNQGTWRP